MCSMRSSVWNRLPASTTSFTISATWPSRIMCPTQRRRRFVLRGATAHRRRRLWRGPAPAADRSYVTADQRLFDPNMRRAFGHGERELAAFAAPAAHLIPREVARDVFDALERLEQIARQHDVLHHLGDLAVANHVPPRGGEREVLEHRLAAERAARIDAELDVADQIREADALLPGSDVGVRHPHDGGMAERHRAGVAGRRSEEASWRER